MNQYQQVCKQLKAQPKTWLVTGVAGFIGSNLLETLLKLDYSEDYEWAQEVYR